MKTKKRKRKQAAKKKAAKPPVDPESTAPIPNLGAAPAEQPAEDPTQETNTPGTDFELTVTTAPAANFGHTQQELSGMETPKHEKIHPVARRVGQRQLEIARLNEENKGDRTTLFHLMKEANLTTYNAEGFLVSMKSFVDKVEVKATSVEDTG